MARKPSDLATPLRSSVIRVRLVRDRARFCCEPARPGSKSLRFKFLLWRHRSGFTRPSTQSTNRPEWEMKMNLESDDLSRIADGFQRALNQSKPLSAPIRIDFHDHGSLFLERNEVQKIDQPAPCTVSLSVSDFDAVAHGKLNPVSAVMTGRIKISGSMKGMPNGSAARSSRSSRPLRDARIHARAPRRSRLRPSRWRWRAGAACR